MAATDPNSQADKGEARLRRDEEFGRLNDPSADEPVEAEIRPIGIYDAPSDATAHPVTIQAIVTVPTITPREAPTGFRVRLTGDAPAADSQQDAVVLAYEYERRRAEWWRRRRYGLIGLPSLAVLFLLIGLFGAILSAGWAGLFFNLTWLALLVWLIFVAYCWFTLPRILSFGRTYRRLVSVPLERGGITWCDSAIPAPDFLTLRNSFFTLYQDSSDMSTRTQPTNNAEDTERKKQTLNDLLALIKPLTTGQPENIPTPFIPRENTLVLDRVELEPLEWQQLADLNYHSLPRTMQGLNTPLELQRLAREVETYASMRAEGGEIAIVQYSEDPLPTPLHRQITTRVNENLLLVGTEIDRWRQRTTKEKAFHAGLLARYKEADEQVRLGYERTTLALEEEIAPPTTQLNADSAFFQEQLESFYQAQREVIESRRDSVLAKLSRERQDLEVRLDERADERALAQAEFKGLNDQRMRLENSTDTRFESLKNQLSELVRRTYSLPPVPLFRSDFEEASSAATAEECVQQLAELRAETRLATSAVNNALNRFARLRFEPLDELARLENQIAGVTKWQATSYLGNLINFNQSGQLLALAGEVSEAAGVYLDSVGDFDRLNRRWCALEVAIRELGLATYTSRLHEAQEYLLGLSQVAAALHSSLQSAPHSPEMARPATFQTVYEQAAGLQRELEELGALAGSITHTQDQLTVLEEEVNRLTANLTQNQAETERVQTDASVRLYDISQKLKKLIEKLEELRTDRAKRMRAHVDNLATEQAETLKNIKTGAAELGEVANTADKLLRRHISRAEQLQEETRQLHRGLDNVIAHIVRDFEGSTVPDRQVPIPSDLLVPVWYFQFKERPLWRLRKFGFASCYTAVERTPLPVGVPIETARRERASLWRFLATNRPATFYRLHEETPLENLVGVQSLDYPANQIEVTPQLIDKLAEEGWLSRWLVRMVKIGLRG